MPPRNIYQVVYMVLFDIRYLVYLFFFPCIFFPFLLHFLSLLSSSPLFFCTFLLQQYHSPNSGSFLSFSPCFRCFFEQFFNLPYFPVFFPPTCVKFHELDYFAFFWRISWIMAERLRISVHISNYFQTLENYGKKRSPIRMSLACGGPTIASLLPPPHYRFVPSFSWRQVNPFRTAVPFWGQITWN